MAMWLTWTHGSISKQWAIGFLLFAFQLWPLFFEDANVIFIQTNQLMTDKKLFNKIQNDHDDGHSTHHVQNPRSFCCCSHVCGKTANFWGWADGAIHKPAACWCIFLVAAGTSVVRVPLWCSLRGNVSLLNFKSTTDQTRKKIKSIEIHVWLHNQQQ